MQRTLEQSQAALKVGTGDVVSVREAQARLDSADARVLRAQNAVQIARRTVERLVHGPIEVLADVGPFEARGPEPDDVQAWRAAGEKNQPILLRARELFGAAEAESEAASRARWPRLNLTADYGSSVGDIIPEMELRSGQAGLELSIPIFQGGEISANIARSKAQARVREEQLRELRDQVRLDVETAFLNLKNSVAELAAAEQALRSAETSLAAMRTAYEIGSRALVDLLSSIENYTAAQADSFTARYQHLLNRVRLKRAAGVLSVEDVEAINSLLRAEGVK